METLNFKPSKKGYIFNNREEIETLTYKDYLREFGSDETTTPNGVAPRLFIEGNTVMTWGVRGNNLRTYKILDSKKEAKNYLLYCWENYIEKTNWDAPRFFSTKKELYEDLSDIHQKPVKVIKRYFRLKKSIKERIILSKIKHDNRPLTTIEMMHQFIAENKEMIQTSLKELDELKQAENKEIWQVKANALIQKVCNNDFRSLKWKEIYNLIRDNQ